MADEAITLALNLTRNAAAQWAAVPFNSMCRFGDRVLAADGAGLYTLDDAEADAGEDIEAFFELPLSDFGVPGRKRIRFVWVYYETAGALQITITPDEGTPVVLALPARTTGNRQTMAPRIPVERTCSGYYFTVRIDNIDGCDFSIDRIEVGLTRETGR